MKALRVVGRHMAQLKRDLKAAIKEINGQAAKKIAQGNYAASQEMVALAKSVQKFTTEASELSERWNAISKQQKERPKVDTTPVWEYYRLVARAITALGGDGRFEDIVDWIGRNAVNELKPGDTLDGPKGQPLWQRAVSKTRRPMIKEGFLEAGTGTWKLTKSGKGLASQSS